MFNFLKKRKKDKENKEVVQDVQPVIAPEEVEQPEEGEILEEAKQPEEEEVLEEEKPEAEGVLEEEQPEVEGVLEEEQPEAEEVLEEEKQPEAEEVLEEEKQPEVEEALEEDEQPEVEEALEEEKQPEVVEKPKKKGLFSRLVAGLSKTRNSIIASIDNVFSGFSSIDDDFYEEIEEILVMGDLGIRTAGEIIEKLKVQVKEQKIKDPADCKQILINSIKEQMDLGENAYDFENRQSVLLIIGVNGVGKTTTIGKLAGQYKAQGKKVIMAAADTFRAAAVDQLIEWSERAGVDIIYQGEGADPAAVVFDAVHAAKARNADILLCDTAGRLHNKKNLMEELKKINRVIDREFPDAYRETLVVLDGTTGQNALVQARQFKEAVDISGIILTKLDGTAKGGIAVAIQSELGVPVKYIGIGEKIEDLQKFDPDTFVDALFDVDTHQ
jgi:fused signal recognition particle receptor